MKENERLKGEIVIKGNMVPVEVEIGINWLGVPGVILHVPEDFMKSDNYPIIELTDVKRDLTDVKVRILTDDDRAKFKKVSD